MLEIQLILFLKDWGQRLGNVWARRIWGETEEREKKKKNRIRMNRTEFCYNTSLHASTRKTEAVNRTLEMYLRCFTSSRPKEWVQWVPWAEFCYNTSLHASTRKTPFEVVYGRGPPTCFPMFLVHQKLKL